MFTRSEVIVLTNKQTNKQTPLKTVNARTLGKNMSVVPVLVLRWAQAVPSMNMLDRSLCSMCGSFSTSPRIGAYLIHRHR